jgi:hypothetical protein
MESTADDDDVELRHLLSQMRTTAFAAASV